MENIIFSVIFFILVFIAFNIIYFVLKIKSKEKEEVKEEGIDISKKRFLLLKTISPSSDVITDDNILMINEMVKLDYTVDLSINSYKKSFVKDSDTQKEGLLVTDVIRVSGKHYRDISKINKVFEYIDDYIKIDDVNHIKKDLMFPNDPAYNRLLFYKKSNYEEWSIIHKLYKEYLYKNSLLEKYNKDILIMKGIKIDSIPNIFKEIFCLVYDFYNTSNTNDISINSKVEKMLAQGYIILTNKFID